MFKERIDKQKQGGLGAVIGGGDDDDISGGGGDGGGGGGAGKQTLKEVLKNPIPEKAVEVVTGLGLFEALEVPKIKGKKFDFFFILMREKNECWCDVLSFDTDTRTQHI